MPVLRASVQLPAKFSAGKSFLQDVASEAAFKLYAAQSNVAYDFGEMINSARTKAAAAVKHAAAAAIMPILMHLK